MIIKSLKITLAVVIFLLMTMFTYWGFFVFDKPNLIGGSVGEMMHVAYVNPLIPAVLLIVTGGALFWYFKKPLKIRLALICFSFFLWVLSGRMVGLGLWPDGRLCSGWFGIGINEFYLCDQKTDCETALGYQTKTENLFFWRVRIKNKNTDRVIFIGPVLWPDALTLFKHDIGSGKYTVK